MNLKVVAICAFMMVPAFAGKIITYTATSQQSQEEANNAAMAGVAKQVSAQVKVTQILTKEEISQGNESNLTESYKSNSNVLSDIKIKGISVKPEPAAKGYKATATLDMDEFTADIQFKMKSIQIEISQLEESVREAIKNRQYSKAISAIGNSKHLIKNYNSLVTELGKVYPINDSHRLKHDFKSLEESLINQLSSIKIEGPSQQFTLTKAEMPAFSVVVTDKNGALGNFPLVAKQGRNILAELNSRENGTVSFNLKEINIDKGPYVIVIEPNLPEAYMTAAGLRKKLEVEFKATQARCAINIQCNATKPICSNLEKSLAKKSIFIEKSDNAPRLNLEFDSKAGNPIEYIPGKFTTPYDVTLSLKGKNIVFVASGHENGKQESDAVASVVKKMNFDNLRKQLEPYCK